MVLRIAGNVHSDSSTAFAGTRLHFLDGERFRVDVVDEIEDELTQISVEEENRRLYSLKCEFHYLCEDDEDERQMVMQAIEMVSPCLEELIAFMTLQIYPKTN